MLCADTSFLFSLYRKDAHSAAALERLHKAAQPLLLSALNAFELGNALRLAEFRGLLAVGESVRRMAAFQEDGATGLWRFSGIPLEEVVAAADRLSSAHTQVVGHRAFDILHVAHAQLVRPKFFLSFDANQLLLAKVVGLRS
jgi:predicted nucleic acid-binding protein